MNNQAMGAGSGPEQLAKARRIRSNILKMVCFVFVALPLPLIVVFGMPIWTAFISLIVARVCFLYSQEHRRAAERADHGGKAERVVADKLLKSLAPGWTLEAGIVFDGIGDIDIFVTSPSGKAFVIDVKSHRGAVKIADDQSRLLRQIDGEEREFERDVLKGVCVQAARIGRERSLNYVIPVLAFTKAKLLIEGRKVNNVIVVESSYLVELMESIEASTTPDYMQNRSGSGPSDSIRSEAGLSEASLSGSGRSAA